MIVWLASYPRSGNTFLRVLLKSCFDLQSYSQYNDVSDIGVEEAFTSVVGHSRFDGQWDEFYRTARDTSELVPIKTHHPPQDEGKAIYLVRDPRSVVVSYDKYLQNYSPLKVDRVETILGATAFGSWGQHINEWHPTKRKHTLLIHYEKLVKETDKVIDELSDFLEIERIRNDIPTFSELKDINSTFFSTGSNQRNISSLTKDELNLLNFLFKEQIKLMGYDASARVNRPRALSLITGVSKNIWSLQHEVKRQLNENAKRLSYQKETLTKEHSRTIEQVKETVYADFLSSVEQVQQDLKAQQDLSSKLSEQIRQSEKKKKSLESKLAYRDRALETTRRSLAEAEASYRARTSEIDNLISQLKDERERVERFQVFISDLTSQKVDRERHLRELEAELEKLQRKATQLSNRNQELLTKYSATKEQLLEVNAAVAPRLKSILTLKPLRYVANRRALVKRGVLKLDDNGLPIIPEHKFEQPADLQRRITPPNSQTTAQRRPEHGKSIYQTYKPKKPLGVAVYTFDRADSVENVLESLLLQDGLENTHVWIDGDQGNQKKRARLDETEKCVSSFPVKQIHRNRGNYGFRKMMIVSMRKMFEQYERVLFLEDDCFPTRHALRGFSYELDRVEDDPSVMSVYGHPFLTESEQNGAIGRFQGWGWASTREKLLPLWQPLLDAYLMSEDEYKSFIQDGLTEDVLARLDVTPGRQPSSTLSKFFAWDETLGFLAAVRNLKHVRSTERLIYNFGVGESSTHFNNIDHYRKPPFNMVTIDEIWSYY